MDAVIKIADYFNVSIDYLIYGDDSTDHSSAAILSEEDTDWLNLIHQLPQEKQYEFHGELIGYLKAMRDFQSI